MTICGGMVSGGRNQRFWSNNVSGHWPDLFPFSESADIVLVCCFLQCSIAPLDRFAIASIPKIPGRSQRGPINIVNGQDHLHS